MKKDWKAIRSEVLERDSNRCQLCGENGHLDIHHLEYDMFNRNATSKKHLVTLCDVCHGKISGIQSKDSEKVESKSGKINIEELRQKLGLTQEAFAIKIGISVMTVRRWESGKTKPSRMAQKLLAEIAVN